MHPLQKSGMDFEADGFRALLYEIITQNQQGFTGCSSEQGCSFPLLIGILGQKNKADRLHLALSKALDKMF